MKKIVIQILLVLFLSPIAHSQDIEIELQESLEITGDNGEYPHFVNLEENGLLWIKQERKNDELSGGITAVLYDESLMKHQKISYQLEGKKLDGYSQSCYLKELNKLFIFINRQKQKGDIVCFDVEKRTFQSFKVDVEPGFMWGKQPEFKVVSIGNKPHMLVFENSKYFLSELDFKNGVLINKQLPELFNDKRILSIESINAERFLINYFSNPNSTNLAIIDSDLKLVLAEVLNYKNESKNKVVETASSGGIGLTKSVLASYNYSISKTDNGFYVSGLYSSNVTSGYSGFFAAKIENDKPVYCKQYTFKDFKHFFDFAKKKEKWIGQAEKDKYFFPGQAFSYKPFISDGNLILSFNNYNTEDPSTIIFLKTDPENGTLVKDQSIAIKGYNILSMITDTLENAYYFSRSDKEFRCVTYSEGEASDGDDFKLDKFLNKNETFEFLFSGGLKKWYGNYYYCVTTIENGGKPSFFLKKLKLILR